MEQVKFFRKILERQSLKNLKGYGLEGIWSNFLKAVLHKILCPIYLANVKISNF